jgi:hypothetical protein
VVVGDAAAVVADVAVADVLAADVTVGAAGGTGVLSLWMRTGSTVGVSVAIGVPVGVTVGVTVGVNTSVGASGADAAVAVGVNT